MQTSNEFTVVFEYRLTKVEPQYDPAQDAWIVELGGEHSAKSNPIQKRWVRNLIKKEYPYPIKDPTQKRYLYDTYFKETALLSSGKLDEVAVWRVVVQRFESPGVFNV